MFSSQLARPIRSTTYRPGLSSKLLRTQTFSFTFILISFRFKGLGRADPVSYHMYYRYGTVNITLVKAVTKNVNKDIYVCVRLTPLSLRKVAN